MFFAIVFLLCNVRIKNPTYLNLNWPHKEFLDKDCLPVSAL
jgi:hypothetical protein